MDWVISLLSVSDGMSISKGRGLVPKSRTELSINRGAEGARESQGKVS